MRQCHCNVVAGLKIEDHVVGVQQSIFHGCVPGLPQNPLQSCPINRQRAAQGANSALLTPSYCCQWRLMELLDSQVDLIRTAHLFLHLLEVRAGPGCISDSEPMIKLGWIDTAGHEDFGLRIGQFDNLTGPESHKTTCLSIANSLKHCATFRDIIAVYSLGISLAKHSAKHSDSGLQPSPGETSLKPAAKSMAITCLDVKQRIPASDALDVQSHLA